MEKEEKIQNVGSKHITTCPECEAQLPFYTEKGKHNFLPKSTGSGGITLVCIKCKKKETISHQGGIPFGKG